MVLIFTLLFAFLTATTSLLSFLAAAANLEEGKTSGILPYVALSVTSAALSAALTTSFITSIGSV